MRNNQDFEKLVFERAEEIKARDRKLKVIRTSLMPLAAAFVVLTAVGIHGAFSSNTAPNMADNTTAANEERSYTNAAKDNEAEYFDYGDNIAGEQNDDMAIMQEDAAKTEAPEEAAEADKKNNSPDIISVTFISNAKTEYTDSETINAVSGIIERTPTDTPLLEKGYIGTIETVSAGGKITAYKVYTDHLTKVDENEYCIAITEEELTILSGLFS